MNQVLIYKFISVSENFPWYYSVLGVRIVKEQNVGQDMRYYELLDQRVVTMAAAGEADISQIEQILREIARLFRLCRERGLRKAWQPVQACGGHGERTGAGMPGGRRGNGKPAAAAERGRLRYRARLPVLSTAACGRV